MPVKIPQIFMFQTHKTPQMRNLGHGKEYITYQNTLNLAL